MGAKDSFIWYADTDVATVLAGSPEIDRGATADLVGRLFSGLEVSPAGDGNLGEDANPDDGLVYAAVWPGASVVCTSQVALDRPSRLARHFLDAGRGRTTYVHAMHSVVDWFAYGVWEPDGSLRRALSVSSDDEVIEDVGTRLPFEQPFWEGRYPAVEDDEDDYPLVFHPLELSEAALEHLFGFVFEGHSGMTSTPPTDPFDVPLAGFRVGRGRTARR